MRERGGDVRERRYLLQIGCNVMSRFAHPRNAPFRQLLPFDAAVAVMIQALSVERQIHSPQLHSYGLGRHLLTIVSQISVRLSDTAFDARNDGAPVVSV